MFAGAIDTDVAIETPEHIVFRYRVAGPARRFLAYLLDLTICYGAFAFIAALILISVVGIAGLTGALSGTAGLGIGLVLLLMFAAQWLYFAVLEGIYGATPGKRALGLRVVTSEGRPIGFRESTLRNLLRVADALPAAELAGVMSFVGLGSMLMTKRFQRLGDLVAGTMVIVPETPQATRPIVLSPPAEPSELASLPDEISLDAEERLAIEIFLRRRASLGRARELELANMIAPIFRRKFDFTARDPSRALALIYDRAMTQGRTDAPPSSLRPFPASNGSDAGQSGPGGEDK